MRILAGTLKGRSIKGPSGKGIRPTPQIVREAIFDILGQGVVGATVLDLFAGTGALGLEALSRGASYCAFVDISFRALSGIRAFLEKCNIKEKASLVRWDLRKGIPQNLGERRFSIVFMDPPYDSDLASRLIILPEFHTILAEDAKIIVESRRGSMLPEVGHKMIKERSRVYGDTQITIYVP